MLLVADIGNTNITLGAFDGERLLHQWRLGTQPERTADEFGMAVMSLLRHDLPGRKVGGVVYGSVVPRVDPVFETFARRYLGLRARAVTPSADLGIRIRVDRPEEVGADRLLNGLAAHRLYGGPAVVLDFGTATTFDCVSGRGDYLGGAILIGPRLAAQALGQKTAKLPEVDIRSTRRVIGKNTVECIQAGLYHGYLGMVSTMLDRTLDELGGNRRKVRVIATGGLASLFAPAMPKVGRIAPDLTLQGLRIAADIIS